MDLQFKLNKVFGRQVVQDGRAMEEASCTGRSRVRSGQGHADKGI